LGDVIVFSRSPEEHLKHLDEVLTRLEKAGVTLKAAKFHFHQEEVEFLDHVIRPGRVLDLEKNLRALKGPRYIPLEFGGEDQGGRWLLPRRVP